MKVRTGFVTNSSSTSYTIVVRDNPPEGFFSIFDLLQIAFSTVEIDTVDGDGVIHFANKTKQKQFNEDSFRMLDVRSYIENARSSIEWQSEEIPLLEADVEKYENLLKQPEEIIACFADSWQVKREGISKLDSAKEKINRDLAWKKKELEKTKKTIEFDKKQLAVLEEFEETEWGELRLLFIDVDNFYGRNIDKLIERSNAIVLKKERT